MPYAYGKNYILTQSMTIYTNYIDMYKNDIVTIDCTVGTQGKIIMHNM